MSRQRARRQPPEARQQQPHPAHSAPAGRLTLDSDERALRLEPGRDCDRSTSRDARPVRPVTKGATAASRLSLRTPTLAPGPQAVRGPSWPTRGPRGAHAGRPPASTSPQASARTRCPSWPRLDCHPRHIKGGLWVTAVQPRGRKHAEGGGSPLPLPSLLSVSWPHVLWL